MIAEAAAARAARSEASSPYVKWLNEDVVYIVSDEERAAFQTLATNREREKCHRAILAGCGAIQPPVPLKTK